MFWGLIHQIKVFHLLYAPPHDHCVTQQRYLPFEHITFLRMPLFSDLITKKGNLLKKCTRAIMQIQLLCSSSKLCALFTGRVLASKSTPTIVHWCHASATHGAWRCTELLLANCPPYHLSLPPHLWVHFANNSFSCKLNSCILLWHCDTRNVCTTR